MNMIGLAIGVFFSAMISGILIWIVGKLGLGLQVDGLGTAFVAGIAIALIGGVISWVLGRLKLGVRNELLRFIVNVLLGAVVLLISARLLPGLSVNGFTGALVASLAIGLTSWLLGLLLRPMNRAAEQQDREAGHVR